MIEDYCPPTWFSDDPHDDTMESGNDRIYKNGAETWIECDGIQKPLYEWAQAMEMSRISLVQRLQRLPIRVALRDYFSSKDKESTHAADRICMKPSRRSGQSF